jgi:hypothetical protein
MRGQFEAAALVAQLGHVEKILADRGTLKKQRGPCCAVVFKVYNDRAGRHDDSLR